MSSVQNRMSDATHATLRMISAMVLLSLAFIETWLMHTFPRVAVEPLGSWTGEVLYAASLMILIVLAYAAWRFAEYRIIGYTYVLTLGLELLALVCYVLHLFLLQMHVGAATILLQIGVGVVGFLRPVAEMLAALTLAGLDSRRCLVAAAGAGVILEISGGLMTNLPTSVGIALFMVLPLVYTIPSYLQTRGVFSGVARDSRTVRDFSVTEPRSLMQLPGMFFFAIFLFRVILGFTKAYYEGNEGISTILLAVILLILLLVCLILLKPERFGDSFFTFSAALVMGGIFLSLLPNSLDMVAEAMLVLGSDVFLVLSFYILAQAARQNLLAGVFVFSIGLVAINAGSFAGYILGLLARGMQISSPLATSSIFALMGYALALFCIFSMRRLSFDQTIASIQTLPDVPCHLNEAVADTESVSTFLEDACAAIAEEHMLTPREAEVLALLSRGRSISYIQGELSISYGTVKTHVHHIYQKLDVHSQQELISMVDNAAE